MLLSEQSAVAPTFTAGPWEVVTTDYDNEFDIVSYATEPGLAVAQHVSSRDMYAIAALPELIEALTVSLANLQEVGNLFEDGKSEEAWEWILAARTMGKHALAKARGEV